MLVIRDMQKRILALPLSDEYAHHAYAFVLKEYPDEIARRGEEGVRDLIRRAMTKGDRYQLTRSNDVTGLLALMIVLGEDFEVHDGAKRQLLESPLPSDEKMAMLLDEMVSALEAKLEASRRPRCI